MSASDSFQDALRPDPSVALLKPVVEPWREGPAHRVQYVVELVGPRSAPAGSVGVLLSPDWFAALGKPQIYVMRPSDNVWQKLLPQGSGAYDSIALCWDILSPNGAISRQSGEHLLKVAEQFGSSINRRAIPLPTPSDLDKTSKALNQARDGLDIGVSLMVLPASGSVSESDLWVQCARLGLEFSPSGSFDWRVSENPYPLFSVTPIGQVECFSLRAVQANETHEGVTLGFSVPLCPAPLAALDGALSGASVIAQAIRGAVFDDTGRPLTPAVRDGLRRDLQQAVGILEQNGLRPGSPAAVSLFSS